MAENFDFRKCESANLPQDIALTALRQGPGGGIDAANEMIDKCSLTWARNIAKDFQIKEAAEDAKQPGTYQAWEDARFRTPEVREDKAYLFRSTAQMELVELANKYVEQIAQKREKQQ